LAPLSCSFEADSTNEGIEIVDDALIKAIELRSPLLGDLAICADRAEEADGERRIDPFEQLQEDEADRVSCGSS
jgi:hypothetical protein